MRVLEFRRWDAVEKKMYYNENCKNDMLSMLNTNKDQTYLQFTGLLDKNGKKIYEGDLVTFMWKNPNNHLDKMQLVFCEIIWNKTGMWSLKWSDGYINNRELSPEKYEVIGNRYETMMGEIYPSLVVASREVQFN